MEHPLTASLGIAAIVAASVAIVCLHFVLERTPEVHLAYALAF